MENKCILAIVSSPNGKEEFGIFSNHKNAEDWVNETFPEDHAVVFAPFVIDDPNFGNRRVS